MDRGEETQVKIRFRRKSTPEWLVLFIVIMPIAFSFLMEVLGLPSSIKYILDIAWLFLLFYMAVNRKKKLPANARSLAVIVICFFAISLVGVLCNYQSIYYYLWGLRNNARFFVFFFACILFLDSRSVDSCLRCFDVLFWVNFPITLFQFFALGKKQDYLGGIFGTTVGCNSYMNIFLVIVITKSILLFLYHRESLFQCILKCGLALIIAVLSELKIFFVELLIVISMAMILSKFSFRKIGIVLLCFAGVVTAAQMVAVLFPDFAGWFSIDGIREIIGAEEGYTMREDINRLTAGAYVMNRFLPTGYHKLFGLGLGNCDYAAFDFLTTPFYTRYGWTHYVWFSLSFLLVETGIVGLALYIFFFAKLFFAIRKIEIRGTADQLYCQLAEILSVISFVLIIYNSSLRTEAAYLWLFVLSMPFVQKYETTKIGRGNS